MVLCCRREQSSIGKSAEEKLKEVNLKVAEQKTKANRHLLLIRHGQYHTAEETDDKMILSDLGMRLL
jgi:serine/threonine-protein phosphatase PGAM5